MEYSVTKDPGLCRMGLGATEVSTLDVRLTIPSELMAAIDSEVFDREELNTSEMEL